MRKHRRPVIEVDLGLGEKYQISQTGVDRRGKPDAKDVVHRWKMIQLPGTAPIAGPLCYPGSGPWHVSCTMEAKRVTCPKCLELMNGTGGPVTLDKIRLAVVMEEEGEGKLRPLAVFIDSPWRVETSKDDVLGYGIVDGHAPVSMAYARGCRDADRTEWINIVDHLTRAYANATITVVPASTPATWEE